jgi:hypothetical protein
MFFITLSFRTGKWFKTRANAYRLAPGRAGGNRAIRGDRGALKGVI